jgi:hypothetical protein
MWEPDDILAVAREVRAGLKRLLPRREARAADAELGALLARAATGEDVTTALIEAMSRRDATREAAFGLLRGERGATIGGYQSTLGVPLNRGARYACPRVGCKKTGDRLDDSEPEPRCEDHDIAMHRL